MTFLKRRRFRPTLIATLFAVPLFVGMVALGTWQLFRMEWKDNQIALRHSRASASPVDFSDRYPGAIADPRAEEFTALRLRGSYRHDREFYLGARTLDRRIGFFVITPFVLAESSDQPRILLVNRGWIPRENKDPTTRQEAQIAGHITEEILLRADGWRGYDFVRPTNDVDKNFWFYVDSQAMAQVAGLTGVIAGVYGDARARDVPGGYPLGGQTRIQLVNNHLEYVITWYSLAVILAVIYVIFHLRRDETLNPRAEHDTT